MTMHEFLVQYGDVKFKCCGRDRDQVFMRLNNTLVWVNECDEMIVENMPMQQIQPLINRIIELPENT